MRNRHWKGAIYEYIVFCSLSFLNRDPDVSEIFSRGQNPQHWHVAKRGLGRARDIDGDVYLEVARKETSLTDVDNMLAGIVKGFAD